MDPASELLAAAVELSSTLNTGMELLVTNELANLRSSEAEERELTPGGAAVRTVVVTAVLYRAVATCCAVVKAGAELAAALQQLARAPSGR